MKPDLRADYKVRLYTGPKTPFFEVSIYKGAGHGWEQLYPQAFVPDAVVTKDCFMVRNKRRVCGGI